MRRLIVAIVVAFLAGFSVPQILAQLTYNNEFLHSFGWTASISTATAPFKELMQSFGWLASLTSAPAPNWQQVGDFVWRLLVEQNPMPSTNFTSSMGFSASVSTAPAPFSTHRLPSFSVSGLLNITMPTRFAILKSDEWWIAFGHKLSGNFPSIDLFATDFPLRVQIICRQPPCTVRAFFPFRISDLRADVPEGAIYSYVLEHGERGTVADIELDKPDGQPFMAIIRWLVEVDFTVTDYRGRERDGLIRIRYVDGTSVMLVRGTNELEAYPISGVEIEPAERLSFEAGPYCRVIPSETMVAHLLVPLGGRCELRAWYVLNTSLSASLTQQAGGLYRVEGVLVDEEGSPVPGRRIQIILRDNLTRPVETVTDEGGRFLALVYIPPSNSTRELMVRFPGEKALLSSSKVLVLPGAGAPAPRTGVPVSAYALIGGILAALAAVLVLSFARASRRAHAVYRTRRVLR